MRVCLRGWGMHDAQLACHRCASSLQPTHAHTTQFLTWGIGALLYRLGVHACQQLADIPSRITPCSPHTHHHQDHALGPRNDPDDGASEHEKDWNEGVAADLFQQHDSWAAAGGAAGPPPQLGHEAVADVVRRALAGEALGHADAAALSVLGDVPFGIPVLERSAVAGIRVGGVHHGTACVGCPCVVASGASLWTPSRC